MVKKGLIQSCYIVYENSGSVLYYTLCRGDIHIVRVDSILDRETTREYNLTVIAMDGGNPSRLVTVHVERPPESTASQSSPWMEATRPG
jgi:hypothetical protein